MLLNLSPYGRSQVAEHVDWSVWLAIRRLDLEDRLQHGAHYFNANDYKLLIQMVLNEQGVALGFDHLVSPLIARGCWSSRCRRNCCWKTPATTSPTAKTRPTTAP